MAHLSVAKGEAWNLRAPDVRGWEARDAEGHALGEVERVEAEGDRITAVTLEDGRSYPVVDVRSDPHAVYVGTDVGGGGETSVSEGSFDARYRRHFDGAYAAAGRGYEAYRPAYAFGRRQALGANFAGRTYAQARLDLRARYELEHPGSDYGDVAEAVRYGFETAQDAGPLEGKRRLLDDQDAMMAVDEAQINTEGEPPSPEEAMQRAESMAVGPPPNRDTIRSDAATDYSLYEERFKEHFDATYGDRGEGYAGHASAYRLGLELSREGRYRGKPFEEAEPHAREVYERRHPNRPYDDVREAVRHGYEPLRS